MEHETLTGEVWVDERGEAVVVLPDHLHGRELEHECRLRCGGSTRARAHLSSGRLGIASPVPQLRIAWRLEHVPTRPTHEKGSSHAAVPS